MDSAPSTRSAITHFEGAITAHKVKRAAVAVNSLPLIPARESLVESQRNQVQMLESRLSVVNLTGPVSRAAGGLFDAMRNLVLEVENGDRYSSSVMGLNEANFERDRLLWGKVDINAFRVLGPRSFGYAPELSRALHLKNPALVHIHGLWIYPSVAVIRWSRRNKPYVISPHGMLDPWALKNSRWKKRISAALYEDRHLRGAACLHALNHAEAEAMRAYGLKNPICVIPNGVELPIESEEKIPRQGNRSLVYLGRLHPKKGLPLLVEAWCRIQRMAEESGWRLIIAGWDQLGHQSELQRLAAKLHSGTSIEFVGPRFGEAKSALFLDASAFILPSLSEGLPMSILEAWSWHLPVLMTTNCNLPEGLKAGAAIMMEANVEGICGALSELFSMNGVERETMGANGRRLVEEQFQRPRVADQMTQVYNWILGDGRQPTCVLN
ncbi:MAG: glycosyltransferase [Terracidiphilus sp.]